MKIKVNRNNLFTQLFIDQLVECGIKFACISPGSRSTPLVTASAKNKKLKKFVIIDERTSGFFALGLSKTSQLPALIVTTSGTAVAELYPAIIEAYQNRVPLIICTADRPKHLRNTGANQTINQKNIFKNHIRQFYEVEVSDVKLSSLKEVQKVALNAFNTATIMDRGPVHINFLFDKPLEPDSFTDVLEKSTLNKLKPITQIVEPKSKEKKLSAYSKKLISESKKILIFAGAGLNNISDFKSITKLSRKFNLPIIADGASGLRFSKRLSQNLITNFDSVVRSEKFIKNYKPDLILHFGRSITSQKIIDFFESTNRIIINPDGDMFDSTHKAIVIKSNIGDFVEIVLSEAKYKKEDNYLYLLKKIDSSIEIEKNKTLNSLKISEPYLINALLNSISENSNIVVGNSLPVRDVDFFASKKNKHINIFENRGASGIDGMISTALGIAKSTNRITYLLIGDLSFYHDLNSLLIAKEFEIPLKIILINNNGAAIFNHLPISDYNTIFEKYFIASKKINFKDLVHAFHLNYRSVRNKKELNIALKYAKTVKSSVILEVKINSVFSVNVRKKIWNNAKSIVEKKLR